MYSLLDPNRDPILRNVFKVTVSTTSTKDVLEAVLPLLVIALKQRPVAYSGILQVLAPLTT